MTHLALSYLKMFVLLVGAAIWVFFLAAMLVTPAPTGFEVVVTVLSGFALRFAVRDLKRVWRNRFVVWGRPQ